MYALSHRFLQQRVEGDERYCCLGKRRGLRPRALKSNGSYCTVGGSFATFIRFLLFGYWIRRTSGKTIGLPMVQRNREDLEFIAAPCVSGKIAMPSDKRYPLSEVLDVLCYFGEGHAKGQVVNVVDFDKISNRKRCF